MVYQYSPLEELYEHLWVVRNKIKEVEERDRIRNFQPPVTGEQIMKAFNLKPCREIGRIKDAIKEGILEGEIPNEPEAAYRFMIHKGLELGLTLSGEVSQSYKEGL